MRFDAWDILIVAGLSLVAVGAWTIHESAGFIVAGLECIGTGVLLGREPGKGRG